MEVGIRELRAGLSRWLERVRAGEELVVTDRGVPVARVLPVGRLRPYDSMVAAGLITPARSLRSDRHTPHPVATDGMVSDLVADQRR